MPSLDLRDTSRCFSETWANNKVLDSYACVLNHTAKAVNMSCWVMKTSAMHLLVMSGEGCNLLDGTNKTIIGTNKQYQEFLSVMEKYVFIVLLANVDDFHWFLVIASLCNETLSIQTMDSLHMYCPKDDVVTCTLEHFKEMGVLSIQRPAA